MQMPNVIATPHLGASTEESEDNCAVMAVKELMDYLTMVISRIPSTSRIAIWACAQP